MAAFTEQQKTEFSMQKWYDLSGKTAVVTGGITGLGLAITRCLVSAGAKVIALSRTDEKKGNEILKEKQFSTSLISQIRIMHRKSQTEFRKNRDRLIFW